MGYDFNHFKQKLREIEEYYRGELSGIRTGRATPLLLDSIHIDSYGTRTAVKHVASLSIEDARTLRVTPWDKGHLKAIETAIAAANIGVSTAADTGSLRVIFPELSAERRTALAKLVKEKLENARISVRQERERIWNDIQSKEKEGALSEDAKFKARDDLQKLVDDANKDLEEIALKKEREIQE